MKTLLVMGLVIFMVIGTGLASGAGWADMNIDGLGGEEVIYANDQEFSEKFQMDEDVEQYLDELARERIIGRVLEKFDSVLSCSIEQRKQDLKIKVTLDYGLPNPLSIEATANGSLYSWSESISEESGWASPHQHYLQLCSNSFHISVRKAYGQSQMIISFDNGSELVLPGSVDNSVRYLQIFLYGLTSLVLFYAACYVLYLVYCGMHKWTSPKPKPKIINEGDGVVNEASKDINEFICSQKKITKSTGWDWSHIYLNKNPLTQPLLKLKLKTVHKWPINLGIALTHKDSQHKLHHTQSAIYGSNCAFFNGKEMKLGKGLGFKGGDIVKVVVDRENNFVKWQVQDQVVYGAYVDFRGAKDGHGDGHGNGGEWRFVVEMREKGDEIIVME